MDGFRYGVRGTVTDRSSTVATGGVSQQAAPASLVRSYFFIQNPSGQAESLFVNFINAASTVANNSEELLPGSSLEMKLPGFVSTDQINVTAATQGHPYVCKEA